MTVASLGDRADWQVEWKWDGIRAQFIRRGAMDFTTATGARFSCGDGTGRPVSVKFLTADAERRVLINPELALGEVNGSAVKSPGEITTSIGLMKPGSAINVAYYRDGKKKTAQITISQHPEDQDGNDGKAGAGEP